MRHFASAAFWKAYRDLPPATRDAADTAYALLKSDPHHPSLRLKRVGPYWSARIGLRHRALAVDVEGGLLWFWIGNHAEYDRLIK
ncbi:MAG TPA: hypothetical protein VGV17_00010 [Bosea sp. (in: a-proteobacteria)]|jgi:hypothetical protein|uniref:type II toxin-antitoxin system RelE family toxin n=1 Tax=Bosea sp. (in: a-proteobacteria) TaxID=1871050 RepID=UPI002DDD8225|nr:hypothetical protein [Bosea sp. (in: a-proteobacteria)]HEV2552120.1 hypothetical protein [Bosea sp. (in: a-proteobacteria)]